MTTFVNLAASTAHHRLRTEAAGYSQHNAVTREGSALDPTCRSKISDRDCGDLKRPLSEPVTSAHSVGLKSAPGERLSKTLNRFQPNGLSCVGCHFPRA